MNGNIRESAIVISILIGFFSLMWCMYRIATSQRPYIKQKITPYGKQIATYVWFKDEIIWRSYVDLGSSKGVLESERKKAMKFIKTFNENRKISGI